MKYFCKYILGGILYLFVQFVIILWHFDFNHNERLEDFFEGLKDFGIDDDYCGYG